VILAKTEAAGERGLLPEVLAFTSSLPLDRQLLREDLAGSLAHLTMLARCGIVPRQAALAIRGELLKLWDLDPLQLPPEEDVHMAVEARLTAVLGETAGMLHTARSRNDQVALDMRLWLRDEITGLRSEIRQLQRAFVDLAVNNIDVVMAGYTHLQRAQPVYFAHHLLAYVEMLERDQQRLVDAFRRVNVCPLGSGAIAGSTLALDREMVARLLGFLDEKGRPVVTQNSMDAVSDRDFAVEFCAAGALLALHISRLAEDLILWSSSEFGLIRISDAYTTGSSLMPQKKNPDVAELARGKSARVIANLVALLTLLKGLPMSYNRDLQEDKQRLFDTADTVRSTVRICAAMLRNLSVNKAACAAASADPALLATDLVDYLVGKGVRFRDAHHLVGEAVALAERKQKSLDKLQLTELRTIHEAFGDDVRDVFNLKQAMARRTGTGAPGTAEVRKQLARWTKLLPEGTKP